MRATRLEPCGSGGIANDKNRGPDGFGCYEMLTVDEFVGDNSNKGQLLKNKT